MSVSPSELVKAARSHQAAHETGQDRQAIVTRLFEHMQEISDDPAGSDPALYLSEEDAATCRQFVALADQLGWPNAHEIGMRSFRLGNMRVPVWKSPLDTAKAGLTKKLFFPEINKKHRAYFFGTLSVKPTQTVALCDDGKLRSHRGTELDRSYGEGWGCLPDLAHLQPALGVGQPYGVDYRNAFSYNLSELLLSRLPAGALAGLDLSALNRR